VLIFLKQMIGLEMVDPILIWWPLILIVLGLEIVVFMFLSKQESPVVKYDFLSIIFISILGTMAIVFTLFTSLGVMNEIQTVIHSETQTLELPKWEQSVPSEVEKVIIQTGSHMVQIDGSNSDKLHILGTYRTNVNRKDQPTDMNLVEIAISKVIGDTLFIFIKDPVSKSGPFSTYTYVNATIVVPVHLDLEVRGNYALMDTYPDNKTVSH